MNLRILAVFFGSALIATMASAAPFIVLFIMAGGSESFALVAAVIGIAAVLNLGVGLPTSAAAFWWLRDQSSLSLRVALKTANVIAALFAVLCYFSMGGLGFLFYGVPGFLAGNVWALCLWRWGVRPDVEESPIG